MLELLFSISFFLTDGHILDTKFRLHKYDEENYQKIFYLKDKKSCNSYCIKHTELENITKLKRANSEGGRDTHYKIMKISK